MAITIGLKEKLQCALDDLENVHSLSDFIGALARISLLSGEYPEISNRIKGLYSRDTLVAALWDLILQCETFELMKKIQSQNLSKEALDEILADAYN